MSWTSRARDVLVSPRGVLVLATLCLALFLSSELPPPRVHTNDLALHVSLARGLETQRTLDFWHGTDLGYPVLRVYQPLYHLGLVALDALSGFRLGLSWWAAVSVFALAFALPLGTFLGIRRWLGHEGLPPADAEWMAATAALLAAFSISFTGFGFDPLQGLWGGFGVITQTWAMVGFAPAFARAFGYISGREPSVWPALALGFAVAATSLIVGVMLFAAIALRAVLAALLLRRTQALLRLAAYAGGLALVASSLWLPMVRDVPWVHYPARLFAPWVNQGFGQATALRLLFSGRLLDGTSLEALGRLPVMTALVTLGALACVRRWRRHPGAIGFLLIGFALWFSLLVGRQAWGSWLYWLPLLRSYQWGRFEAMVQFWGVVIAALGVVWAGRAVLARRSPLASGALLVLGVCAFGALFQAPRERARKNRAGLAAVRASAAARHAEEIAARVAGDPARTATGGPTTWEAEVKEGGVWLGVAVVAHGVSAVGRIFQGMGIASGTEYIWDGKSPWGAQLLGVGNWLAPCARMGDLPVLAPPAEVAPGICLAVATLPPPLAFFSLLAASPAVPVAEEQVLDLQKEALARADQDVFLPFRLSRSAPAAALPATRPLPALAATGFRFAATAPGRTESHLQVDLKEPGAIVFPVPFHPRLEGSVDDVAARPFPVLPGYAAIRVERGRHRVNLVYRADRLKDVLFLAAIAALGLGPAATRRLGRARPRPAEASGRS